MATQPLQQSATLPDLEQRSNAEHEQFAIEHNLKSLIEIPWEQCPWPAVRLRLLRVAIEGADIYAYTHGPFPDGRVEWVIWHRQTEQMTDARHTPEQWARQHGYGQLVDAQPIEPGKEAR